MKNAYLLGGRSSRPNEETHLSICFSSYSLELESEITYIFGLLSSGRQLQIVLMCVCVCVAPRLDDCKSLLLSYRIVRVNKSKTISTYLVNVLSNTVNNNKNLALIFYECKKKKSLECIVRDCGMDDILGEVSRTYYSCALS